MTVKCKFVCQSVLLDKNGGTVTLTPVTTGSPENESFFKWTPFGEIKMGVLNEDAVEQFVPGRSYYIDFTPAD